MTNKETADKMFLSARTIDGYHDDLFEKLHVKTRVGLVMYAIRNGIANLSAGQLFNRNHDIISDFRRWN